MVNKIKKITIEGIRGIRAPLVLEPGGQSMLIFGENGTGKSSITDAFEWFFTNRVGHLAGGETGRTGLEGLRNIFLGDRDPGSMEISFDHPSLDSRKTISLKKDSPSGEHSQKSREFADYLKASINENLTLRHGDLAGFILATKKEKLDSLSGIIGFSQLTRKRDALRKTTGELDRDLKRGDFDNRIGSRQSQILEYLGCVVNSENQFVTAVNELIAPLTPVQKAGNIADIEAILESLQRPQDSKAQGAYRFYGRSLEIIEQFPPVLGKIEDKYKDYHGLYGKILGDIEKLNKILLEKLLTEGVKVIKGGVLDGDLCPLCLQPRGKGDLLQELESRIGELEEVKLERDRMGELKASLKRELDAGLRRLEEILSGKYIEEEESYELKTRVAALKKSLEEYLAQVNIEITSLRALKSPGELGGDGDRVKALGDFCRGKIQSLKKALEKDPRSDIYSKILLARQAYYEILDLRREKEVLQGQRQSMEAIYSEFLKMQKDALETFLARFSGDIDDFYRFMNPGEQVEDIKLVPLEKDDELQGITMEFKFYDQLESPPQKYLSESHLGCLGIAFFLSSVKAFNKNNHFFILDDIVSDFDREHGRRFVDLLLEKFAGYQVILLTHERDWFEMARDKVRGKGWRVRSLGS